MKNNFAVFLYIFAYIIGILGFFFGIASMEYSPGAGIAVIVSGILSAILFYWLAETLNLLEAIKDNTSKPHYVVTSNLSKEHAQALVNTESSSLPKI